MRLSRIAGRAIDATDLLGACLTPHIVVPEQVIAYPALSLRPPGPLPGFD